METVDATVQIIQELQPIPIASSEFGNEAVTYLINTLIHTEAAEPDISISQSGESVATISQSNASIENALPQADQSEAEIQNLNHDGNLVDVGIQAYDYEIERRSGKNPARKRIIPFKFRDYMSPDVNAVKVESDSDYEPDADNMLFPKKRKTSTGQRGRPRKQLPEDQVDKFVSEDGEAPVNDQDDATDKNKDDSTGSGHTYAKSRGRPRASNSVFRCSHCGKEFTQKGNLKVHQRIHSGERPFRCDAEKCEKIFRCNESLRRHKMSHLGVKPFQCSICDRRFSSNVSLQEHLSIHTNSKPYECNVCHKMFRQISCLRRHQVTHTSDLPYACDACDKKFSQLVYLRSHRKVHTGEKPFQCQSCDKRFAHQSDLIRHKIIHSGEKPFACNHCGVRFSDPSSRRRHLREHVGDKPYPCHLCGEGFKRSGQLKAHLYRKHSNSDDKDVLKILKSASKRLENSENSIDDRPAIQQDRLVKLIRDLNNDTLIQHIVVDAPLDVQNAEAIQIITDQTPEVSETVIGCDVPSDEPALQSVEGIQCMPMSEGNGIGQGISLTDEHGESTVIAISEMPVAEDNIGMVCDATGVQKPTEYTYQIIHDPQANGGEQQIYEVHYTTDNNPTSDDKVENLATSDPVPAVAASAAADYVNNPDFGSQEYYNWLSNFTELCQMVSMPLDVDLFQKISMVHKTLSDVMATPSGVVAIKDNFRILMTISKDLNTIINEHLVHVLENLEHSKEVS